MKIVGFAPFYNVLSAHYPFMECIICAMPLVDEMIINDGGCTDGTREALERLEREVFPGRIKFFDYPHKKGDFWDGMDEAIDKLINTVETDWFIEVQADECFHPDDHEALRKEIEKAHNEGYNAIRQGRVDVGQWENMDTYIYKIVRIFRKNEGIISRWGGDCFHFEWLPQYREGFTTHNLPPEYDSDILFYHFKNVVPAACITQAERHSYHYALKHEQRRRNLEETIEYFEKYAIPPYIPKKVHEKVHPIFYGLIGKTHYEVREELYDKEFLRGHGIIVD